MAVAVCLSKAQRLESQNSAQAVSLQYLDSPYLGAIPIKFGTDLYRDQGKGIPQNFA